MSCSVIEVSAYYDGELDGRRRAVLAEHVKQCPSCASTLKSYGDISRQLKSLPSAVAPASLRIKVYNRLDDIDRRRSVSSSLGAWSRGLGLVAAAAMVALVASALLRENDMRSALFLPSATFTTIAASTTAPMFVAAPASIAAATAASKADRAAQSRPSELAQTESPVSILPKTPNAGKESDRPPSDSRATKPVASGEASVATDAQPTREASPAGLSEPSRAVVPPADTGGGPIQIAKSEFDANSGRAGTPVPVATGPDNRGNDDKESPSAPIGTSSAGDLIALNPSTKDNGGGPDQAVSLAAAADCMHAPARSFGVLYQANQVMRETLGCVVGAEQAITLTEVASRVGYIFDRGDRDITYSLADAPATWQAANSKNRKAIPSEQSEGRMQPGEPTRAVDDPGRSDTVTPPRMFAGQLLEFERGLMLLSDRRVIYVLYADGTWQDFPEHFPR